MKRFLRWLKGSLGLCENDGCWHRSYCCVAYRGKSLKLCRDCDGNAWKLLGYFS